MHQAAYVLAAFAFGSQLLALVRDRLLAAAFGAGHTLDIYYAAFRIPDLLFATVASLLSLYALLPILSHFEAQEEGKMVSFMRRILVVFFVAMGVIAAVLYVFIPSIIPLIAPGIKDAVSQHQLILLAQILLLQPIFLGASNILAALVQLRHRFFLYSISPLLYNLGIIIGIVFFYPRWGIGGLGLGVVFGAAMHMLVQVPFFTSQPVTRLAWKDIWKPLGEVLMLSVPRTLALAAGQISILVLIALASLFTAGSVAVFMFGFNLQAVPLTIIGVSYSVAAFPTLARFHASGKTEEFKKHIEVAMRHILFWSVPATVLIIVLRAQIVRIILGAGAFDWSDTRLTAAALALFIISLSAQSISMLIARAYYAAGRTKMPLLFGVAFVLTSSVSALVLSYAFLGSHFWRYLLESMLRVSDIVGTTVLMLAFAYTLGALAQCTLGLYYFSRDFGVSYRSLVRLFFQSFSAGVLGGAAAYGALTVMGNIVDINTVVGILSQGAVGGVVGVFGTIVILMLLKNPELREAYYSLRRRLSETPPVALEPTDVAST